MSDKKNSEIINTGNKSFEEIDKEIQSLSLQKNLLLDEHLKSNDPESIIKASTYLKQIEANKDNTGNIKAYLYSPEREFYTGMGYKSSTKSLSFSLLRSMAKTPIVNSIITTRVDQISRFTQFTTDTQKEGWTVRKKQSRFDVDLKEPTDQEKRRIDAISKFIEDGGFNQKWDLNDDFPDYIKKTIRDSLELDQSTFECERNRRGELVAYTATDGATMRYLETIDRLYDDELKFDEINGYQPIYAQVWNNKIAYSPDLKEPIVYYPWELSLGIRNKTSNIRNNGYGTSELEVLVEIVTWMLWGMQYNGNFFKQGSNPKGFFTIEGATNQAMLGEFRSAWRNMMSGVVNAHKVPVFEGGKVSWESMQETNKDMEFSLWNEFLILITCSIYKIDPNELGFRFKSQGTTAFGKDGQKERFEHSKDKGLKPLLVLSQKQINKYIVSELDDAYEFLWTGVDLEDETQVLDNDKKKIDSGFMSLEDGFEKHSGRKFDPKKDTILNAVYQQAQQAKQFGGEESNAAIDQMAAEENTEVVNPFNEFGKGENSNPIAKETMDYLKTIMNT
jgi:hypothetical protein